MSKILVRQKKSLIGHPKKLKRVVQGLGLNKIGDERTHKDNNCTRGMINKAKHVLEYKLLPEGE